MSQGYPFEPFKIDTGFKDNASYGPHEGLDINGLGGGNTDCGTPIKCIYPGVIVHTSDSAKDYGKLTVIECNGPDGKRWVRYCHLQNRAVDSGLVSRGDIVGYMGSTGNSTACHLHLDVLKKKPTHWRYYSKSIDTWFENPNVLINAKIDDMPSYVEPLLRDDLKIDITKSEGEVRGRVGEIKNAIQKYNEQEGRIKELEKKVAFESGEAAKFEEELVLARERGDRFEKELKEVREMVVSRDNEIGKLTSELETLKKNLDPETSVIINKDEYQRLTKRRNLDKHTNTELIKEVLHRYKDNLVNYFRR